MVRADTLPFEVYECGEGDKLALCLHGFPEHAMSWRHQMPMLAGLGYRVWAPNQRGYGKSYRPPHVADYDITQLMQDVGSLIDASEAKSVVLIAHDWGGVVAWHFAMRHIRPLEKLVIMNAPHPAVFREQMDLAQFRRSWYIFAFQFPFFPERLLSDNGGRRARQAILSMAGDRSAFPEVILDILRQTPSTIDGARSMINWYRAAFRGGMAKQRRMGYPEIDVPTLLIWGEEDKALMKKSSFGTERFVSDFRIRYLPGVSHWVQQEAPDAVNAMVRAFLLGEMVPEYEQVK